MEGGIPVLTTERSRYPLKMSLKRNSSFLISIAHSPAFLYASSKLFLPRIKDLLFLKTKEFENYPFNVLVLISIIILLVEIHYVKPFI